MVVIGEDGEAMGLIIYDCDPENWSISLGYVLARASTETYLHRSFLCPSRQSQKARKYLFDPFRYAPQQPGRPSSIRSAG